MPVIGHVFVGIATAQELGPAARGRALTSPAAALWMPAVVALAYLPDIVTQLGYLSGWPRASLVGHSAPVGVALGTVLGLIWARASRAPAPFLVAVAVGSILGHDLLDLLQATDRAPLWPFSNHLVSSGWLRLPRGPGLELLLFGLAFAAYAAWRRWSPPAPPTAGPPAATPASPALLWIARVVIVVVVGAALFTQNIRRDRERQLNAAERLLGRQQYADALQAADRAEAWPSTTRPGRIDVIRGEAYEGLGDQARAEMFYRRAYEIDPLSFWALADLAEFYASCRRTRPERQALTQPLVEELKRNFPRDRSLPSVLAGIELRLLRE